jgi:TPP-dependent 2-oxoacid decarboxylase
MTTLVQYFINRLLQLQIDNAFSVSGDYITPLLNALDASSIKRIGNANEQDCAYAAVRNPLLPKYFIIKPN